MQADTGAWQALPEIPWATQAGTGYRDLGRAAARLLADIRARLATASPVELALLADQVAGMHGDLRALAKSELVALSIYEAGQASPHRAVRAARPDHLRLV